MDTQTESQVQGLTSDIARLVREQVDAYLQEKEAEKETRIPPLAMIATEGAVADLEARLRWHPASPERVRESLAAGYAERANQLNNLPLEALQEAIWQAVRAAQKAESAARADPYGCFVNPQEKVTS